MLTPEGCLRIVPFGGCGEIGMNLTAFCSGDDILLIDCGLMFPEPHMLGIDLVLPDVAWLKEHRDAIRGILLTHGHEDHVGGLPYLLPDLDFPPLYGTPLTLGLVQRKLEEFDLLDRVCMQEITAGEVSEHGSMTAEYFSVAHSIVDGVGIALRTPAGLVVHTGDFKLDLTPVDDRRTDLARLAAYGEEGVLLLLADSTNVERGGMTLSERVVGDAFAEIFPRCRGQILVSTFSSNIHRIQQVIDAALVCGRKIYLEGRSMIGNCAIARELGYLSIPETAWLTTREYRETPANRVVVLVTGSQGEPMSVLSRVAHEEHKLIQVGPGDMVVFSSKQIPGNEKAISSLINLFYRQGAEVVYEATSEIHVSGHASREELRIVHSLVRPVYFIPVHGEYRHLVQHAKLAVAMGVDEGKSIILDNGMPLLLSRNGCTREERLPSGRVFVDGRGVGDISAIELRDRRQLGHSGTLIVILSFNRDTGELLTHPELVAKGCLPEAEIEEWLGRCREQVVAHLQELPAATRCDAETIETEVRKVLRRFLNRELDRRPLILPIVLGL